MKKQIYKRWWFWVIVILVIGGIGTAFGDDQSVNDDEAAETTVQVEEDTNKEEITDDKEEESDKELTIEEQVEKIIIDELGATNNNGKETIAEINNFGYDGTDIISVTLNASDRITTNMTKKGMWLDSVNILESISELDSFKNLEMITIIWQFPLVDQYGNTEDGKVMSMDFKKETLEKINWDNFQRDNLPNVADNYWEHPALGE